MEETQKNSGTESSKAKSTVEYMKGLEKLAPSVEFRIGNSYASDKSGKTLTINPQLLEKMQNDPKMEKKMKELIQGVEKMTKFRESMCRAAGRVVVYRHSYIDANGKCCQTALTIKKDELNEKLRKQAEEISSKKLRDSGNKESYLDNKEIQLTIDAAKERANDKTVSGAGVNIDDTI